jgi:hypothetical protein
LPFVAFGLDSVVGYKQEWSRGIDRLLPRCFPSPKAKMKIDTQTIRQLELPSGKTDAIYFDDELAGFGIRLRTNGERVRRTWVAQYRAPRPHPTHEDRHRRKAHAGRSSQGR